MSGTHRVKINGSLFPYDDATSDVVIERSLMDIWKGTPGKAGQCMNAQCILRNKAAFPHKVIAVSVIKTRVYILDKPDHAIRYTLSQRDAELIDTHDVERVGQPGALTLRAPRGRDRAGVPHGPMGPDGQPTTPNLWPKGGAPRTGRKNYPLARGEEARMIAAVGAMGKGDS